MAAGVPVYPAYCLAERPPPRSARLFPLTFTRSHSPGPRITLSSGLADLPRLSPPARSLGEKPLWPRDSPLIPITGCRPPLSPASGHGVLKPCKGWWTLGSRLPHILVFPKKPLSVTTSSPTPSNSCDDVAFWRLPTHLILLLRGLTKWFASWGLSGGVEGRSLFGDRSIAL